MAGEILFLVFPFVLALPLWWLWGRRRRQDLWVISVAILVAVVVTLEDVVPLIAMGQRVVTVVGLPFLPAGSILSTIAAYRGPLGRLERWTVFLSTPILCWVSFFILLVVLMNLGLIHC